MQVSDSIADYVETLLKHENVHTSQLEDTIPFMMAAIEYNKTLSEATRQKVVRTFIKLRLALVARFMQSNCPYEASYHFRCSIVLIIDHTDGVNTIPGVFADSARGLRNSRIQRFNAVTGDNKSFLGEDDTKLFEAHVENMRKFETGMHKLVVEANPTAAEPLLLAAHTGFCCPTAAIVQGPSLWACRAYLAVCSLHSETRDVDVQRRLIATHNVLLQAKSLMCVHQRWSLLLEHALQECEKRMVALAAGHDLD